jgi:hypothetical protein
MEVWNGGVNWASASVHPARSSTRSNEEEEGEEEEIEV